MLIQLPSLIRTGNISAIISYVLASLVVIFLTLPFHEYAHAFVADKLGDRTARYYGRLTLNPFSHIDYFGSLCIILIGFGWAKPVPVNAYAFKNPKRDMAITALAGPIANILLAFGATFIFYFLSYIYNPDMAGASVMLVIAKFLSYYVSINVALAVFNLLPVPPLDGSRLLGVLLPERMYFAIMQYERYFSFAIIILVYLGVFDAPINFMTDIIYSVISFLPRIIFGY